MRQRVLYSVSPPPGTSPHETLLTIDRAAVIAAADEVALPLIAKKSASVLYFSRHGYDHAVRKLTPQQREESIHHRLRTWAPDAINHGMEWTFRLERRCLHLAARAGNQGAAAQSLEFLERVANEGRYGSVTTTELLINILESESLLITELGRLDAAAETAARNEFDLAIGKELRALGRPEFGEHLPQAKPIRGVFVRPRDPAFVRSLRSKREPFVEWQDGLVTRLETREIERLSQNKRVTILYPSSGAFLQDLSELTQAQLHREFAERADSIAQYFAGVWAEYANDLRLNTAMVRRAAHERAEKENKSLASLLANQVQRETTMLVSAFAPQAAPSDIEPATDLSQAQQGSLEDIRFISKLSAALGPADLHRRYEALASLKQFQTGKR